MSHFYFKAPVQHQGQILIFMDFNTDESLKFTQLSIFKRSHSSNKFSKIRHPVQCKLSTIQHNSPIPNFHWKPLGFQRSHHPNSDDEYSAEKPYPFQDVYDSDKY